MTCNAKAGIQSPGEVEVDDSWQPENQLRTLVDERERAQRARIGWNNRLLAASRLDHGDPALLTKYADLYREVEKELTKDIQHQVKTLRKEQPIFDVVLSLPGIAEIMAARVLIHIDIRRAGTVSALNRYAGYGVVDGAREKRTKGEPMHYNNRLKIAVRNLVEGFIKLGDKSPYARLYYQRKAEREATGWGKSKMHRHNDAIGYVAKIFLSHLWLTWRQMEGLPTDSPYAIGVGGHTHEMKPAEFGWPSQLHQETQE